VTEATLELADQPQLKANPHGGYIIRQSDLGAWARCQLQKYYVERARLDLTAPQPEQLSATAFGTVMHYALMLLEQLHHEGDNTACEKAVATFEHYWHPDNIEKLTSGRITQWLPRQTYGSLRDRGRRSLRDYYKLLCKDEANLLALEYQFAVPIRVNGRTHTLTGTIDKLNVAFSYSKPYVEIRDFKTGRQPTYLRYNQQGSAYAYSTTRLEFWTGWDESGCDLFPTFDGDTVGMLERTFAAHKFRLHHRHLVDHPEASRRFRWINMADLKNVDGGWRNEKDYARLKLALDAYVRANEAGVYSPTTTGEVCVYCAFRGVCGGVALPDESYGSLRP
jgi:RecB family exonuclease